MTDNQQQIEEIQLIMLNAISKRYFSTKDVKLNNDTEFLKQAEALYNAGWCKVDENAVVLTQEEYNQLVNKLTRYKNKKAWAVTKEVCEEYRKEMAKEILKWLVDTGVINTAPDTIKMYFKEHFGVEAE